MKILFIIIGAFISISCIDPSQDKPSVNLTSQQSLAISTTVAHSSESTKWTENFLELREAITAGDRNALKSFIDFPIKNKGNEIWYLADSKLVMEISSKEIKPFTEADFNIYFSSIFALDLRKTLEKLNIEDFFKTNKSTSPEIEVVKGSKSRLEASFDNKKHKITLALVTIPLSQDNWKYTIYYQFDVLNDQNIKFREIHIE